MTIFYWIKWTQDLPQFRSSLKSLQSSSWSHLKSSETHRLLSQRNWLLEQEVAVEKKELKLTLNFSNQSIMLFFTMSRHSYALFVYLQQCSSSLPSPQSSSPSHLKDSGLHSLFAQVKWSEGQETGASEAMEYRDKI